MDIASFSTHTCRLRKMSPVKRNMITARFLNSTVKLMVSTVTARGNHQIHEKNTARLTMMKPSGAGGRPAGGK